ncbi:MAG: hypothetical protein U1E78_08130 [Gammaproteobacteria bacterium]
MLRKSVLLRNAIYSKYEVRSQNNLEFMTQILEMDPADQNAILELNRRLTSEISMNTQSVRPIPKDNTKRNVELLSYYLSEKNHEAAIQHVKDHFTEIETKCIVDLALHHGSYDFVKLFLQEPRFAPFLTPDSLRKIVTQFCRRSLVISIALCENFAKKIGYDYLVTLSIERSNLALADRLMTTPKLISRFSINKIIDLSLAYPSRLGGLLDILFDPSLRGVNPGRDVRWIIAVIDGLYLKWEPVQSAIHEHAGCILYMLELGSQVLSKERLLANRFTDAVLANTIATSELLRRTLGLTVDLIENTAPTFMNDYPRRLRSDHLFREIDELGGSFVDLEIDESTSLNHDNVVRSRTCACYCKLL